MQCGNEPSPLTERRMSYEKHRNRSEIVDECIVITHIFTGSSFIHFGFLLFRINQVFWQIKLTISIAMIFVDELTKLKSKQENIQLWRNYLLNRCHEDKKIYTEEIKIYTGILNPVHPDDVALHLQYQIHQISNNFNKNTFVEFRFLLQTHIYCLRPTICAFLLALITIMLLLWLDAYLLNWYVSGLPTIRKHIIAKHFEELSRLPVIFASFSNPQNEKKKRKRNVHLFWLLQNMFGSRYGTVLPRPGHLDLPCYVCKIWNRYYCETTIFWAESFQWLTGATVLRRWT